MKSGPFIALVAKTLGVEPGTARLVARALREAGWLTTGARGVNAPEMTASDAARLILAFMTGAAPSRVVAEFQIFRSLELQSDPPPSALELAAILGAGDAGTIEYFLTLVVQRLVEDRDCFSFGTDVGRLADVELTLNDQSHTGILHVGECRASFMDFARLRRSAELKEAKGGPENWTEEDFDSATFRWRGITTSRTVTSFELIRIADGLAGRSQGAEYPEVIYAKDGLYA